MGQVFRLLLGCFVMLGAGLSWQAPALAQVTVEDRLAEGQPPIIAPFRGFAGAYPENSLAGIAEAVSIGAGIIDIQVQITSDGQLIVFHDQFLNGRTDVEAVFEQGPPGGPTREERYGRDYLSDYTLAEVQQLHLLHEGVPTEHGIPTLAEALDLVGQQSLVLLSLNDFDLDRLLEALANRPTDHILIYNVNPEVLAEVVAATGLPAFISLRRSRVFDTTLTLAILDAHHEILGDSIAVGHLRATRELTPELVARSQELGIVLSVSAGREDFALEQGDPGPWAEALELDAAMFWSPHPEQVLEILNQ